MSPPGAGLTDAEIELLDVGVLAHLGGGAFENDAAVLHDVAVLGDGERHFGVLLDEQDSEVLLGHQLLHDLEDLFDEHRRVYIDCGAGAGRLQC